MTAAEMIRRLEKIQASKLALDAMDETKQAMADLNAEQLKQGILNDGSEIRWLRDAHYPYTIPYAKRKAKEGFQVEVVDLNKSIDNAFYRTEEIKVGPQQVTFSSSIKLGEYLENNYGKNIWGLTNESKATYQKEYFFSVFRDKIKAATGLRFA